LSTREQNPLPELLESGRGGDRLRVRARVPAELACFAGHFPGRPLLPGVLQLAWVVRLAQQELGVAQPVAAVEALKFRTPLLPEQEFELSLEVKPSALRFWFRAGEDEVSSGRLRLDPKLAQHAPQPAGLTGGPDGLPLRLPHAGDMRLLDDVLSHDRDLGVTLCRARVREATPLYADGRAPAWLALEWMAQAMAAQGGLEADPAAPPRRGFLVGARRLELRTRGFLAGERLWVRARHQRGETGFVVCDCAVGSGPPPGSEAQTAGSALAVAALKAWVEADAGESATR